MYYVSKEKGKLFVSWAEYITATSTRNHKQRLYKDRKTGKYYMLRKNPYTGNYNRFTFLPDALTTETI